MSNSEVINNQFRKSPDLRKLQDAVGSEGISFLSWALGALGRLLPHTKTSKWTVKTSPGKTQVKWGSSRRREIVLQIHLRGSPEFFLTGTLTRMTAEKGLGLVERTLDLREFDLCTQVASRIASILQTGTAPKSPESLRAIRSLFDEQVVAAHLKQFHNITFDLGLVFSEMRGLAEQSYENKSISYGLLIRNHGQGGDLLFPSDYFAKKRYRALSDGFRTVFEVNKSGRLLGLKDIKSLAPKPNSQHFYPEWCEDIAESSSSGACGMVLTRQGDLLVFDSGSLRFTYRSGRWQYWNHIHVCDLFRNRMRVQHVPKKVIPMVVRKIYRAALDVAFRRSGALFVILRNKAKMRKLVIQGDAIGDAERERIHQSFDDTMSIRNVQLMARATLTELSSLDGGVVLDNKGRILAYGAVLKASGRFNASEGSRTKAAISASRYGIALKVSSDGDVTFFEGGKVFLAL